MFVNGSYLLNVINFFFVFFPQVSVTLEKYNVVSQVINRKPFLPYEGDEEASGFYAYDGYHDLNGGIF